MRSELSKILQNHTVKELLFHILVFEGFQTLFLALFALMFMVVYG